MKCSTDLTAMPFGSMGNRLQELPRIADTKRKNLFTEISCLLVKNYNGHVVYSFWAGQFYLTLKTNNKQLSQTGVNAPNIPEHHTLVNCLVLVISINVWRQWSEHSVFGHFPNLHNLTFHGNGNLDLNRNWNMFFDTLSTIFPEKENWSKMLKLSQETEILFSALLASTKY